MSEGSTLPEKNTSKPQSNQLSKKAIQELIRPHTREAIDILVSIMRDGDNDNVRMGAAKTLLSKVVPDLKAESLDGSIEVVHRNVVRLPNKRPLGTPPGTPDGSVVEE